MTTTWSSIWVHTVVRHSTKLYLPLNELDTDLMTLAIVYVPPVGLCFLLSVAGCVLNIAWYFSIAPLLGIAVTLHHIPSAFSHTTRSCLACCDDLRFVCF
eukprot:NODE_6443_length_534_cov_28.361179_g6278_i0.p2 GENE.NODE_6443_length_534_cov_28.361179_g6278_i0~~NODE_6443_length_534_cov_28.361179_g6278_i0.p2  ORF type:complete len:100 (+),score=2.38 NODE_6443_length_534_cov_28.361179_g6278_i0:123-422(+)